MTAQPPATQAPAAQTLARQTLLVFAHADEAEAFARDGVPHLITGVGKVNAALELTRAITQAIHTIEQVLVFGTAGAVRDDARFDTVYQVTEVIQHDFSLTSPRLQLSSDLVGESATIATGDAFVTDDDERERIAGLGASLVDMESYAYASVCARLEVPLRIFKSPSDFANSSTTMQEWDDVAVSKSEQLLRFAHAQLPEILK